MWLVIAYKVHKLLVDGIGPNWASEVIQLLLHDIRYEGDSRICKSQFAATVESCRARRIRYDFALSQASGVVSPVPEAAKPKRKLGTLRGKVKIIDPNWAAPMTDEEVEVFVEGRY